MAFFLETCLDFHAAMKRFSEVLGSGWNGFSPSFNPVSSVKPHQRNPLTISQCHTSFLWPAACPCSNQLCDFEERRGKLGHVPTCFRLKYPLGFCMTEMERLWWMLDEIKWTEAWRSLPTGQHAQTVGLSRSACLALAQRFKTAPAIRSHREWKTDILRKKDVYSSVSFTAAWA